MDEHDFPRGSTASKPKLSEDTDHDPMDLFQVTESEESPAVSLPKRKRDAIQKQTTAESSKRAKSEGMPQQVHVLTFRQLVVDMLLLGVVKEIHDLELLVSLPNHLTGTVAITEISPKLTGMVEELMRRQDDESGEENDDEEMEVKLPNLRDYFHIGQPVVCRIIEINDGNVTSSGGASQDRKQISLSLMPSSINSDLSSVDLIANYIVQASVKSAEDHGFILDLGIADVQGFLSHKDMLKSTTLKEGQLVRCAVKSTLKGRVAQMTMNPQVLETSALVDHEALTRTQLKPGLLVNAKVKRQLSDGLWLSFLGVFEGSVDMVHCLKSMDLSDDNLDEALTEFTEGKKTRARILYVYPNQDENVNFNAKERIGLTLKPNLIAMQPYCFNDAAKVGTVLQKVKVIRIDPGVGLLVQASESRSLGYVHISRVSDDHIESLEGKAKYKVGTKHTARIMEQDLMDGMLQLSMQKSVIESRFLRYEDVQVGQVIKDAQIIKVDAAAQHLVLSLSKIGNIRAICTKYHLADVPVVSKMEKRFKVGDSIQIRVLSVDAENKKIAVTHKKTLISSKLPVVDSYGRAVELLKSGDCWVHGVIVAVKSFGCIVQLYAGVQGLIHVRDLSDIYTDDPSSSFAAGQPVKCRIVHVDVAERKLKLSLRSSDNRVQSAEKASVVVGKVDSVEETQLMVAMNDGIQGVLHANQLSDDVAFSLQLAKTFNPDEDLGELLVMSSGRHGLTLTKKPLLIAAAKMSLIPKTIEDLKPGSLFVGFARKVDNAVGVFVAFPGGVGGLVHKSMIADAYISKPSDFVIEGQTVVVTVVDIDPTNQKAKLSMRASDLESHKASLAELKAIWSRSLIADLMRIRTTKATWDTTRYHAGAILDVKVVSVMTGVGVLTEDQHGVKGLISHDQIDKKSKVKEGDEIKTRVLDADPVRSILDLTNRSAMLRLKEAEKKEGKQKRSRETVAVELIKDDYLVVSFGSPLCIGYAPSRQINDSSKPFARFKIGMTLKAERIAEDPVVFQLGSNKPTSTKKPVVAEMGEAVDQQVRSLNDFQLGLKTKAMIRSVKDTQINVILVHGNAAADPPIPAVHGRLHCTEILDDISTIPLKDRQKPLFEACGLKSGNVVDVMVLGLHDAKTHRSLPFSHMGGSRSVVELTMRPSVIASGSSSPPKFKAKQQVLGIVQKVDYGSMAVWVLLTAEQRGRIQFLQLSDDPAILNNITKHFVPGIALSCRVVKVDAKHIDLSLLESDEQPQVNCQVAARISKVCPERGLTVQLLKDGRLVYGHIELTDLDKEFKKDPASRFVTGEYIKCYVVEVKSDKIWCSLIPSTAQGVIRSSQDVTKGMRVSGYIKNIADSGVFVAIGPNVTARVRIADLSDSFLQDWQSHFKKGQLVQGVVTLCTEGHVDITLKQSALDPNYQAEHNGLDLSLLEPGLKLTGTVVRVEKYGVFIDLDGTQGIGKHKHLRGLCHRKEMADEEVKDVLKAYDVGDRVKAVILSVDKAERRINLGLKPSYFESSEAIDSDEDLESAEFHSEEDEMSMEEDEGEDGNDEIELEEMELDNEDPLQDQLNSEEESCDETDVLQAADLPTLALDDDFSWNAEWKSVVDDQPPSSSDSDTNSGDDNDAPAASQKLSKRAKKRAKRMEEERIANLEAQQLDENRAPETADDFDRLLLASPNSSYLWIQYMAFYLNMIELDKSRQIAERALKTIHFREEKEKFNVWLAYLNLENRFGTEQSLDAVFKRAISFNEAKHVHLSMANIYENSDKMDKALSMYQATVKKFKPSCKVWVQHGLFHYRRSEPAEARALLQRSLLSLPKHKHVKIITKFAQMEFRKADAERGRTIMESLMSNYPKRLDLWSVYIDLEIAADLVKARKLFERVIHLKFSSKKMKFLFKKYLDFEKKHGNEDGVRHVVEEARKYVESGAGGD